MRPRPAFALATVLAALVVIGALVAGGIFLFLQNERMALGGERAERALAAAERGADTVLIALDAAALRAAPGALETTLVTFPDGGAARAVVAVLDSATAWVVVAGRADATPFAEAAERRLGVLAVLDRPALRPTAALTSAGRVELAGAARVNGAAFVPDEYAARCPAAAAGADAAGVVTPDTAVAAPVVTGGSAAVFGAPPVAEDGGVGDTSRSPLWSDARWRALARGADTVPLAGAGLPAGDGARPFPRLLAAGDLVLGPDGAGAGLLLVDGDLTLRGPYRFDGVIVVRGALRTEGDGVRVRGAVFARAARLGEGSAAALGDEQIRYAPCVVRLALDGASRVVREARRGWMEVPFGN